LSLVYNMDIMFSCGWRSWPGKRGE
jgi:hypothetical protein